MLDLMKFGAFLLLAVTAALSNAGSAQAQLRAPNEAGIAWGHWHFTSKDVDAQTAFWKTLGGVQVQNGPLSLISFPGTLILVRKADSVEPTIGSNVNHIGFFVKDLAGAKAKWGAAGLKLDIANPTAPNFFIDGPDGIRIEVFENKDLTTPISSHHTHFFANDPDAERDWYVKWFGATPGKRGAFVTAQVPGMELAFNASKDTLAPTKGRALDHIGFEVKNLPAFIAKLQAANIKLDVAPRTLPNSNIMICFITDPWGTYIELTENLAPSMK